MSKSLLIKPLGLGAADAVGLEASLVFLGLEATRIKWWLLCLCCSSRCEYRAEQ